MKKVALAIAATLVLMVVSPAFSQPFADVPTDHWAFDAIAELAAKGLVEGYPDGTFKGDRAMTRYEMAMVVARLLARIEAIKIPPPPPPVKIPAPEVTRADIQTLQRLINEFRAELAALGVRVTAVEEELAALKARVDNTMVTGYAFFRHQSNILNGTNYTYGLFNLTFTGKISSTASATVNMLLDNFTDGVFYFGDLGNPYSVPGVTFDRAYLDVKAYGFDWRLGKQTYQLGPIGLLFMEATIAPQNFTAGDSPGIDGLKVAGSFGPISIEVAGFTPIGFGIGGTVTNTLLMGRASMQLMPGWNFGANLYSERCNWNLCGSSQASNGWSVDATGTLIPGVTLTAEYAAFTPNSSFGGVMPGTGATCINAGCTDNTAYQVNAVFSLGQLTGMTQYNPRLTLRYKKFGSDYLPMYAGGSDLFGLDYTSNYRAWTAQLSLTFSPQFRPYVNYESGTIISSSTSVTELELGFFSQVTTGVTARFRYQKRDQGGTTLTHRYRLQIETSW